MHRETVGYIQMNHEDKDHIEELIDLHQLSNLDCHETELLTDVDPSFINECKDRGFITDEDAIELESHCDIIKF